MRVDEVQATPGLVACIRSGIHAGAVVHLQEAIDNVIGAAPEAGILLADEAIADQHAWLTWLDDENRWVLRALAEGVTVFGQPLDLATSVRLTPGLQFAVGEVTFEVAAYAGANARGEPAAVPLTAPERRAAELAYLLGASRSLYFRKLIARIPSRRNIVLALLLSALGLAMLGLTMKRAVSFDDRRTAQAKLLELFPDVRADLDPTTGITSYRGYVVGQRDLQLLQQRVLELDSGQSVVAVVPMDVVAANVAAVLEPFYNDATIGVTGPGRVAVELPSHGAMKDLVAWDTTGMERRVLSALPELKSIAIAVRKVDPVDVAVPLASLDLSIVPLSTRYNLVINKDGERLFPGAWLKEGRLQSVDRCRARIESSSASIIFDAAIADVLTKDCPGHSTGP